MKFLDPQHPFFKPLWRRILTVVAPAAWAFVELWNGEAGWAIVFFGAAAYAGYELFLAAKPAPDTTPAVDEATRDDKGDEG
ncbi:MULTISPECIES: hypothetical protein [Alphaproteobacteria]|uniref:DUF3329 domain-containing protein n=2 Tax=Alphaproteobacteria TaxID=28211 RepID=A0A512HJC2_9HYPH|nr:MULTISPECIES: hypothetical protein [Alphaproteobacteria]GEO85510.1 hypothetical protein RNA01_24420 [Ciceribacter naphthalenivorans]GLR21468.1 hypothetical protein GCM10007920_12540 [Ciceribacter naphthalenivorans]GLT04324.1 hypothetical protein GCM10007926_12540 [Sphingomonas psychrolutea]